VPNIPLTDAALDAGAPDRAPPPLILGCLRPA
jgi:hypothetical protein